MSQLILLAQSDGDDANALDMHLRRGGFRTVMAADGQDALDLHAALKPDLAVVDLHLSRRDGWDVLGELIRRGDTPVIMTIDEKRESDRLQVLRIGADDCLVKPLRPLEVAARIDAVLRRRREAPDTTTIKIGPLEINAEHYLANLVTPQGRRRVDLTVTEFRLLAHMARRPLDLFTTAQLIEACRTTQAIQERTVVSHLCHLRRKLEAVGLRGMLVNVRGLGYRLEPDARSPKTKARTA